jgi:GT2 family glycosyltransferase/glycosyltransferase involved in cell wall biosynthesis
LAPEFAWTDRDQNNTLCRAHLNVVDEEVPFRDGSSLMSLAVRVGQLLAPIAPPGSARRRALRLGFKAVKAFSKFRRRRYLALQLGTLWDCTIARLPSYLCGDPVSRERMKSAAESPWRKILDSLALPSPDHPQVSIILAVYNHFWKTLECLQAVTDAPRGPTFEVIVIDDRSSDRTSRILSRIPGLRILRNDRRLGHAASCNWGAETARGEYLVFVNQDALATSGWLGALAQTFAEIPGTGLAGAKLILPDGRLLEAGAALWRDGSGSSYGKFDDVGHPWYNFAREVDYCSGGCLMAPRALFLELGGFDTAQEADACEEIDLAFRVRHAGHRVIYQPLARVIQREGRRADQGVTSEPRANAQGGPFRLPQRWREQLDSHPEPPSRPIRLVGGFGGRSGSFGQILVIDHRIPTPDCDCGSFRIVEIIRGFLRRGHHVTFIPDNMTVFSPYLEDLQRIGVEVVHPPFYSSVDEYLLQHGREFKLSIISRADVAERHMETVRRHAPRARIVFDTVDLCFLREERQARLGNDSNLSALAAARKTQELELVRTADRTIVVSPIEKAVLEVECNGQIDVQILPTIYPIGMADPPAWEERQNIVFIGGFDHAPNVDAVLFFAREIFPRIRRRIPETVVQVIGPNPTPEISRLDSPSIHILGYVPDVKPIFDRARVSVAPLRFGAGVKGKVNHSMSLGVPTVVTPIAAEGMYLIHEESAMIADDPASFADAVIRLWTSPELWRKVSKNGLRNLTQHFSVEAAAKPIEELLEWAGLGAMPLK